MTYPEGPDLVKRLIRIENQLEALRRGEMVIIQEMVNLYHRGEVTDVSVKLLMQLLESLKTLKPK